ncbi:hypothetical protein [Thermogymnomonas acidicola]|uniref:hypothetical protein n=1 Tax=Thermogymnomonas acidicola TaxID=399579 RepID=UPI0013969F86|nr:hypothetical protein [Thermogymnomonas acidicola]
MPGGTTTAMTVLRLCGLDFRSSSSMPDDPTELKESVYNDTVSRIARKTLSPGDAVKEAGDYMMCVALGIISESDGGVILAGGDTDGLRILPCIKDTGQARAACNNYQLGAPAQVPGHSQGGWKRAGR